MSKQAGEKKIHLIKIMVFGTFDGLHKGHINFFRQAKKLSKNSFLVASVARDKNVLKIKGQYPSKNEIQRMILVENCKFIDKAILSGISNHIPHILKEKPDIIALGYDQRAYVPNLKKDLKNKGLMVKIVRLKPYKENIYKNHLIKTRN